MVSLLENLSRRTLEESIFASRQIWHDRTTSKVWWDLDSFYQHMRLALNKKQKRNEWNQTVKEHAAADHIIQPFIHRISKPPLAHALNKSVCTTGALHTFTF